MKVLLVEDHVLFRRGLRKLLDENAIRVVGEAGNGVDAVRLARELQPDVVVMDLHMPRMGGVEATRRIMAGAERDTRVLVLTVSSDDADILDAIVAGAAGYLLKDADPDDIVAGLRAVATGGSIVSASATAALVEQVRRLHRATPADDRLGRLTPREQDVLRLIADGRDNSEIAAQLHLSPNTIKNHVSTILEKLEVSSRLQAAVHAVRAGDF